MTLIPYLDPGRKGANGRVWQDGLATFTTKAVEDEREMSHWRAWRHASGAGWKLESAEER